MAAAVLGHAVLPAVLTRSPGQAVNHRRLSPTASRRPIRPPIRRSSRSSRLVCAASMDGAVPEKFVKLANELADAAGEITRPYFRTPIAVDCKKDASPVTIADRAAETKMREVITAAFPSHAVFGEEHGMSAGDGSGEFMWVLDPIDGTKSFITGKPLFGTLISLLHNGEPVLGVIDQPILRERWLGVQGRRSVLNGEEISTRECRELGQAYLYATTPHMFEGASEEAFNRLRDKVFMPLYGCDCYAYGLLASGLCDLVAESDLKPYDYMALVPVIRGAGGTVTDWEGGSLAWRPDLEGFDAADVPVGQVLAAGDSAAHAKALEALGFGGA